jgi:hypothetical protein
MNKTLRNRFSNSCSDNLKNPKRIGDPAECVGAGESGDSVERQVAAFAAEVAQLSGLAIKILESES